MAAGLSLANQQFFHHPRGECSLLPMENTAVFLHLNLDKDYDFSIFFQKS